jgi:hypothetical protein
MCLMLSGYALDGNVQGRHCPHVHPTFDTFKNPRLLRKLYVWHRRLRYQSKYSRDRNASCGVGVKHRCVKRVRPPCVGPTPGDHSAHVCTQVRYQISCSATGSNSHPSRRLKDLAQQHCAGRTACNKRRKSVHENGLVLEPPF